MHKKYKKLAMFAMGISILMTVHGRLYAQGITVGLGGGAGSYTGGLVGASCELESGYSPIYGKFFVAQYSSLVFDLTGKIGNPRVGFLFPNIGIGLGIHVISSEAKLDLHIPIGCKFKISDFLGVDSEAKYSLIFTDPKVTHNIGFFLGIYYRLIG